MLPWVGESLLKIAIGGPGPALGHLSVTRFFALHVGIFGAAFAGLLFLYVILSRRAAVAAVGNEPAEPYWPNQAWRSAAACVAVMFVILLLCLQHGITSSNAGVFLGSPADTDPANAYNAARPEWFLVGVYEFSHWFSGPWGIIPIFIVPGMLVCIALLMPFLARFTLGHLVNVAFTVFLLIALFVLSWISLAKDHKDPAHQKAIALERQMAERVRILAEHEGIPPTGALTLLRNDPKTQGPRLFTQHCASCHDHAVGEDADNIKSEKPTAPNLAGFATRAWIAGLLDPKQVGGPAYFGNTKFTKMSGFVKETLGGLDEDEKKNLEKAVIALSAEAQLTSQKELDAKDAAVIEEGRKLIAEDFGCTDCHKFHEKGTLGSAPDLTGYGSAKWTGGLISNPTESCYYGKNNDRMPAYAASPNDPAQNLLNPREIEMMTNWLRGDWYEPKAAE
jgi:ubiquinol-cytochrome c reductase cytochrome b subunit